MTTKTTAGAGGGNEKPASRGRGRPRLVVASTNSTAVTIQPPVAGNNNNNNSIPAGSKKSKGRGRPPLSKLSTTIVATSTTSKVDTNSEIEVATTQQLQQHDNNNNIVFQMEQPITSVTTGKKRSRGGIASPRKRKQQQSEHTQTAATAATTTGIQPSTELNKEVVTPEHILIIDNGGDTVKFGLIDGDNSNNTSDIQPQCISNITSRLQQQFTVLVGDQVEQILTKNPSSLVNVTYSTERGIITNMSNQIQVWKRILDIVNIIVPWNNNSDIANAFGWITSSGKQKTSSKQQQQQQNAESTTTNNNKNISSTNCAVLIALPPFYPRSILEQIISIYIDDFQFAGIGFCVSTICCAASKSDKLLPPTACIVDVGWSATHIIPTILKESSSTKQTTTTTTTNSNNSNKNNSDDRIPVVIKPSAIRRVSIGGRHLINIWKYYCTYRQWNLMDSDWLLRDVLEQLGYISLNFRQDMKLAQRIPPGRRIFDREYILPDFQTTYKGQVQIPIPLQKELEKQQQQQEKNNNEEEEEDDNEEDDEDYVEKDDDDDDDDIVIMNDDDEGEKVIMARDVEDGCDNDNELDSDDDEEDDEALRKRLIQQKQEEEIRKKQMDAEKQILKVSVERFTVPEILFRPSDGGFPTEWANIPQAIVQSIQACPSIYQNALYETIQLCGGLSQLPNFTERLQSELRALVPCHYTVKVSTTTCPTKDAAVLSTSLDNNDNYNTHNNDSNNHTTATRINNDNKTPSSVIYQGWYGAVRFAKSVPYKNWAIHREEWQHLNTNDASKRREIIKRLLVVNGGGMV